MLALLRGLDDGGLSRWRHGVAEVLMTNSSGPTGDHAYRAPTAYLALFYALLAVWTVVLIPVALSKASGLGATMIILFAAYSWYWSLGISYLIEARSDGSMQFVSARRRILTHAREAARVQGPSLAIGVGFLRFRLAGEMVYAFYVENTGIRTILNELLAANPEIRFKGLPQRAFRRP